MESLYNHYVRDENGNYTRVTVEERSPSPLFQTPSFPPFDDTPPPEHDSQPPPVSRESRPPPPPHPPMPPPPLPFSQLLGQFHLEDVDSGDLLLLGLLFFLFRKGADEELLIALGLLMIL